MEPLSLSLIAHDVIEDEAGRLKVIDTIGSACTLAVTAKADYEPRSARLHRFFELLEAHLPALRQGRPIVWFDHGVPGRRFVLPASLAEFYRRLPPGVARLGWLEEARRQMAGRERKPAHELLHVQEHRELARAARQRGLKLTWASLLELLPEGALGCYGRAESQPRRLEPAEIGLLLYRWGFAHPYCPPWPLAAGVPVCNHPLVDFALERAKWTFRTLATARQPGLSALFPRETYVGLGGAGPQAVAEFAAGLRPAPGMPAAVLKPLATHAGLGISFLGLEEVEGLRREVEAAAEAGRSAREMLRAALRWPFPYTREDLLAEAFIWDASRGPTATQWRDLRWALLELEAGERRRWLEQAFPGQPVLLSLHQPPLAEMATCILQEFVPARPVVSRRTVRPQRGYLRALFLGVDLIAAVHRFARQEEGASFTNLADPGRPTFFEAASRESEERLQHELAPLNAAFLEALRPYARLWEEGHEGAERLCRDMLAANWGAES